MTIPARRGSTLVAIGAAAIAALGCEVESSQREASPRRSAAPGADSSANLLLNPSFEEAGSGWLDSPAAPGCGPLVRVAQPVRSGERALRFEVKHDGLSRAPLVRVWCAVQSIRSQSFPERVGGWYRVEHWEGATRELDLYLQVVLVVWGDPRVREVLSFDPDLSDIANYQIRYLLAGVSEPPHKIDNAHYVLVDRNPPKLGEWIYFELPVRADFERLWGAAPQRFERVDVLFEARWDHMSEPSPVFLDAYYDDLFVESGESRTPES